MTSQKVLIYETVPKDVVMLEYLCKQHEAEAYSCQNLQAAEQILNQHDIQVAFVNYGLERLILKSEVAVIAMGEPKIEASMKIIGYGPICFIPKPLTFATISLGLMKAFKLIGESKSYVSNLVNISMILKELEAKMMAVLRDKTHNMTLTESMKYHCEEYCAHAKSGSQVSNDPEGKYEILNYFTSRGALFCKRKAICELWSFHKWLEECHPQFVDDKPIDLLQCKSFGREGMSFKESLLELITRYNKKISFFYDLKFEYDTQKCPSKKEGLDFKKGDHIFSKTEELVNTN
ncbi:MAG: hypothetical protein KC733_08385, partial [Candidatus Omnitrophica bacterium]|nr:hypothetical protein [Candidatus Omnitrophota bacterium]